MPETEVRHFVQQNTLIYDARNKISGAAIVGGAEWVWMVDTDMVFEPDTLIRLLQTAEEQDADFACGIYYQRKAPYNPCIYREIRAGDDAGADVYKDYPRDSVFEIAGAGAGCVLIRTETIKKAWDTFGPPWLPMTRLGEDISFCARMGEIGARMVCDSRVKVGHIGEMVFDEESVRAE